MSILTPINIIAELNMFNYTKVRLVNMIMGDSPKQFQDSDGNIWFSTELSNFNHLN